MPWLNRTALGWRHVRPKDLTNLQDFLYSHEIFTNNLTSRLFGKHFQGLDRAWSLFLLEAESGIMGVLGIHKHGFAGIHVSRNSTPTGYDPMTTEDLSELNKVGASAFGRIRTLMGARPIVEQLLGILPKPFDHRVDYSMLYHPLDTKVLLEPIEGLICRSSSIYDEERLLPLQLRYEKEEVVLPGHPINPEGTRRFLLHSLSHQIAVHGEYKGRMVTKAMTNARGKLVDQIGGVYTEPEYRGQGMARTIMLELLSRIETEGKAASLFVKLSNSPALRLYANLGFLPVGGFSIVYFS